MKHKRTGMLIVITVLMFASLACDLSGLVPGSGGSGNATAPAVTALWPDVPKLSEMTVIQQDMPVEIRVAVQAFMTAASGNQGAINFISYSTDQTPAEVVSFYSAEKMKNAGWDATDQAGCIADTSSAVFQGGLCLYSRQTSPTSSALLAIVPTLDTANKNTDIFFARIDVKDPTPTP